MRAAVLASAILAAAGTALALPPLPPSLRSHLSSRAAAWPPAPVTSVSAPGVRCSPLDYGGDPLGARDSAPAVQACINQCVNYSAAIDYLGRFPGQDSFGNGKYIVDAGGCTVDLGGGAWKLASPVQIPEYVGNMVLGHGSLIADDNFPPSSFLIVVGIAGSCKVPQGSCNLDLAFPELFLDGRTVASGMQVNNVMGTTVGPAAYFLNFSAYGLQINAGHEVMLDRAWLGETNFDQRFTPATPPKAVAVQINGNDHYILNTVVFSSKVGLEVNGAANRVDGVHVWFPYNQALAFVDQGVKAFHITSGQNRFTGCYIDGSRAVFEGNGLTGNVWLDGFECCAGVSGVAHGIELLGTSVGPGLIIKHNLFRGGNVFSNSSGAPVTVTGTLIEANSFTGGGAASRATLTLSQTAATTWAFNFCPLLIFPTIARAELVGVVAAAGFPAAVIRPWTGCALTVETAAPMTGSITVTADSSALSTDFV